MSLIGNIIWLIFGGLITGLGYILGGLVLCLTIIGIPLGTRAIRLGLATFTPFGKEVIAEDRPEGCLAVVFNVIWVILFGWEIAIAHLVGAGLLAITIVGIPFAVQHLKLIPVAFLPFSYRLA